MHNAFLKSTGFWGTAINHRTKKVTIEIIFPKDRPPRQLSITENNLQRTRTLGNNIQNILPDGRVKIVWEKENPRLYENYLLKWEW